VLNLSVIFNKHLPMKKGFTLIELLIVIAIIAALATMFMSTFPNSQKRGRDAIRRSDIKQYQTALELYANRNSSGSYPVQLTAMDPSGSSFCGTTLALPACPSDPKTGQSVCSGGSCRYNYVSSAGGSAYALWVRMEAPTIVGQYNFVLCSSGVTKETSSTPNSGTVCP
jgi:prepilin-type N-terminal cleavage/methylation domain-containing protein